MAGLIYGINKEQKGLFKFQWELILVVTGQIYNTNSM